MNTNAWDSISRDSYFTGIEQDPKSKSFKWVKGLNYTVMEDKHTL